MIIEERGVLFDPSRRIKSERIACFGSLFRSGSGALFSVFHFGAEKNGASSTLRICRSRDQGRTWRDLENGFATVVGGVPGSLSNGELVEVSPGRLMLLSTWFDRRDPGRPMFDPVSQGLLRTKLLRAFSADEGATWSAWQELPAPGLPGCAHTSGPIVKWDDGAIAFLVEGHKSFDESGPAGEAEASWLMVSRDQGRTFSPPRLLARDPRHRVCYWDGRLCPGRSAGEWFGLFWTYDEEAKKDLNVHFLHGSEAARPPQVENPRPTPLPGQIAAPIWLEDGRLLALMVDRTAPGRIVLWSSRNQGADWTEHPSIYVNDEATRRAHASEEVGLEQVWQNIETWSFGHPAVRSLGDGYLLVTYYAGTPACLRMYWARIKLG